MRLCVPTRFRSTVRWPLKDPSLGRWASSASADSVWARRIQLVPGSSALEKSSEPAIGIWSSKLWSCFPKRQEGGLCFMSTNQNIHWKDHPCPLWVSWADSWWFVYLVDILPMEPVCIPVLKCKIAVFTYTAKSYIYVLKQQQLDMLSLLRDDCATIKMSLITPDCSYMM